MVLTGKVFKFGDNIDTDVIIPARYLVTTDPAALAEHCMEDVSATFAKEVRKGDIIVGGSNFGCGSSREQAVLAIMGCGVKVVLAESFARIFYRNCINRGLYALEVSKATLDRIFQGDAISVDLEKGEIIKEGSSEFFNFKPISDEMKRIVAAGGIIPYTRQRIAKEV
ncbi:MAG: 3-isopropylmalate dehydratase small subunit [Firmicutes bacterium]|nr:3-isopropylmalate dehydratase small subunit [Bacillota bacterium]MDI6705977.1 3-isopropylmalate dehydratase small subunit [Bacillota bacterium]